MIIKFEEASPSVRALTACLVGFLGSVSLQALVAVLSVYRSNEIVVYILWILDKTNIFFAVAFLAILIFKIGSMIYVKIKTKSKK